MLAKLRNQKDDRIILDQAPGNVLGILKFSTPRIEQLLLMLLDQGFIKELPNPEMFKSVPEEDKRQHLAERCIEGLRKFDEYHKSYHRFDSWGRSRRPWKPQAVLQKKKR